MRRARPGFGWRARCARPGWGGVKTDRHDAKRVLRLLMIDGLHAVRVPSEGEEALRDLVRARARACTRI
jgi:transposase